ncbi:MAG: flavodoxin [Lachnospiraceae bacterium]|nr:flavodoxin [Lachnospiraceae bacterium]
MKNCKKNVFRVISVILAFIMVISLGDMSGSRVQAKKKKNVVVLYFSATGITKATAKKIKKKTKGKLIEIKAEDPYTEEDLDYSNQNSRVTKEHESASTPAKSKVRPEIANLKVIKKAIKKADVVYIGYPIWWGEAPHIVYTLVENASLKGKTVIPFSTSISSGLGSSAKHLKARAKISSKTKWQKGRNFYDVPSQKTVNNWVKKLKY